jgi:hypothetical protein
MNHHQHNSNHHTTPATTISSVDYFLLDDPPEPPPPPRLTPALRTTTTSVAAAAAAAVAAAAATPQEPLLPLPPLCQDSSGSVDTDRNTVPNGQPTNRCRLGSSTTNVTSSSVNTVSPPQQLHPPYDHTTTTIIPVERIYFDNDADGGGGGEEDGEEEPSACLLQRGESSYSFLLSSPGPSQTAGTVATTTTPSQPPRRHRSYSSSHRRRSNSSHRGGSLGQPPLEPYSYSHHNNNHHRRHHSNNDTVELSGLNVLNAGTYTIHLIIWWTCAVWGVDHTMDTHWEQTQQHETLVTPATWAANYLWIPILTTEAIFAVAQLLPHYRARPIISSGTSFFFFYTVLLQIMYTFLYSFGLFQFSFICVVLALISLLSLLASQQYHGSADMVAVGTNLPADRFWSGGGVRNRRYWSSPGMTEYILFSFPFYLHAGWLILMAVDHFSLLFRRYGSSGTLDAQIAADIVALGMLLAVAIYALNQPMSMGPDFVIPTVILWSYVSTGNHYHFICHVALPSFVFVSNLPRSFLPLDSIF